MATNDKYDRQLRLWGAEGQRALAHAHVLCLGSSAVATEILKNLVLPGVGAFTIVDDALVNSDDLSGNFFLEISDLGQPRAAAVVPRLLELNPDVRGFSVISGAAAFLKTPQASAFDLVVVANKAVDPELFAGKFPCAMEICAAGFLGSVRLFTDEHVVLDARAEERNFPDLRLRAPWAELAAFAGAVDLAALDEKEHSHVPWAVILLKALEAVGNSAEFPTLKQQVLGMRRSSDEENFDEALENLHVALHAGTCLSEETERVFASLERELADRKFLAVGRAVKKFHETHGRLPLSGKIPDMAADTKSFLALQRLYQEKAERDFQEVWKFLENFQDEAYARRVVKHAAELRVMTLRGNLKEFPIEDPDDEAAQQGLRIYKALKGAEVAAELQEEISRSTGVELHAICAVLGGVAAQEATKLLTKIFTPLDNLFVFNGVIGEGFTLKIAE